jgi:transposase
MPRTLFDKQRVLGKFERFGAMGLQAESAPDPPDRTLAQPTPRGHRAGAPGRRVAWRGFERQRHDAFHLRVGDGPRRTRTRLIEQTVDALGEKSLPPLANGVLVDMPRARHVPVRFARRTLEYDPCALGEGLRGSTTPCPALQPLALVVGERHQWKWTTSGHARPPPLCTRERARHACCSDELMTHETSAANILDKLRTWRSHRQVVTLGVACEVIAPALTPRRPGQRIKTNRRDAAKLVRLFRADELTAIHVPTHPARRPALAASRAQALGPPRTLLSHRQELESGLSGAGSASSGLLCHRCSGRSKPPYSPWSKPSLGRRSSTRNSRLSPPPRPIGSPSAGSAASAESTRSQRILVAEVVDFQRFRRPRELMAYLGLVPSEYSSGETQRGALTKAGNSHVRRVLVEAAWHYRHRPTIGRALASRTQGQPDEIVRHAWRAQQRLHRRYRHLIGHGKRTPIAVAAIARGLVGFIWAAVTRHQAA